MEKLVESPKLNVPEEFKETVNLPYDQLVSLLEQNVYNSVLYGVPFRLADKYAHETKQYVFNDPRRLVGAMSEAFMKKLENGHTTWYRLTDQVENISGKKIIINKGSLQEEVTRILSQSSDLYVEQKHLFDWYETKEGKTIPRLDTHVFYNTLEMLNDVRLNGRKVFDFEDYEGRLMLRHVPSYWSELQIAQRIVTILTDKPFLKTPVETVKKKARQLKADQEQANAIGAVFSDKVSIITGGPGTGKSHTIETLVALLLEENLEYRIKICAPTGNAAQDLQRRLERSTSPVVREYFNDNENKCRTIHSLLKMKPSSAIGMCRTPYSYKKEPLEADVVIVDEMSMVDIYLCRSLLWAMPNHAHVVLVGDSNQLDSVGPGKVLYDLTHGLKRLQTVDEIPIVPKWTNLNQIHRTDKGSRLPFLFQTLLVDDPNDRWNLFQTELIKCVETGDVTYIQEENIDDILNKTVKAYMESGNDTLLLSPRHEGKLGRVLLNETIQKMIMKDTGLLKDTMIIQSRTDYQNGIFNGERGQIIAVDKNYITADFGYNRIIALEDKQAEKDWMVGYAITVHKAQGIEADTVILPIWSHNKTKIWNQILLYTAMTRTKKHLILIGNDEAIEKSVKSKGSRRITRLPLFYRTQSKKIVPR